MNNLKSVLITATALAMSSLCSSQAADLSTNPYYTKAPPPIVAAVYDWSGLYLGVNVGTAGTNHCWDVKGAQTSNCDTSGGGVFGGQLGYRWQVSNWVFGLEGQGNWTNIAGSNADSNAADALVNGTRRLKIGSFAQLTGSVGVALNNVLFYVKGGGAAVNSTYDYLSPDNGKTFAGNGSATRWSPLVGGGIEWGFAQNWSVGAEYDFVFKSDQGVNINCGDNAACGATTQPFRINQNLGTALVRVNYKFGGPVVARY